MFSFGTTLIYGAFAVLLSSYPSVFSTDWQSGLSNNWGMIGAMYLGTQFIDPFYRSLVLPFTQVTWRLRNWDCWSSYVLAAVLALLAVLPARWLGTSTYWSYHIWATAMLVTLVDVGITTLVLVLTRNAPP